jgi:hypothetical protein
MEIILNEVIGCFPYSSDYQLSVEVISASDAQSATMEELQDLANAYRNIGEDYSFVNSFAKMIVILVSMTRLVQEIFANFFSEENP